MAERARVTGRLRAMAGLSPRLVPGSVRARITLAALAVVGAAVVGGSAMFLGEVHDALVHNIDQTAELQADRVLNLADGSELPTILDLPVDADEDDILIQVVDASGRVISASANGWIPPVSRLRPTGDHHKTETIHGLAVDPNDNFRILAQAAPALSGPIVVYVASELKRPEKAVKAVADILHKGALALLVLVGGLTWVMVGRALRPVDSIRRQVEDISEAALDRRVPVPAGHDEISRLARTMNAMLDRLEDSAQRQRRFVADASHELRSPLASSRAQLEVAVAHPETASWTTTASELLEENQRMERLVEDLLFLARRAGSREEPRLEAVDVDDLVLAEVSRLRDRGRVAVDISAVTAARVEGDPEQLGRVVRNLLENAEHHAHSVARVELRRDNGEVELVVADDGPGVPAAHRERIFDRFTRLDDARSRHGGGAGLGLAIAREIVTVHRGRIWAEDPPATNGSKSNGSVSNGSGRNGAGPGARFVVRLPAGA